jgi:hypothetical protein
MKMDQLKKKAKKLGVNAGKMKKAQLVHSIQGAEGNNQCYGRSNNTCDQTLCCFRDDCFKVKI